MNPDTMTPYTKDELKEELTRVKARESFLYALRNTILVLIVVAAATVLVTTFAMPVLHIYGDSMFPTLNEGDTVMALKENRYETGDVIAFYYNNKVLVKRVIAGPGDLVNIDSSGTVYINETELEEPYVSEKAIGECDIEFPFQVPSDELFVMGDHRAISIDSRTREIGCIPIDRIIGKIVFHIWPLSSLKPVR